MSLLAAVLIARACGGAGAATAAEEDQGQNLYALRAAPEDEAAAAPEDGDPRPPPAFPAVSSYLGKPCLSWKILQYNACSIFDWHSHPVDVGYLEFRTNTTSLTKLLSLYLSLLSDSWRRCECETSATATAIRTPSRCTGCTRRFSTTASLSGWWWRATDAEVLEE